jgi:hypothetical protein
MSIKYSDFIDPEVLEGIVGADYQNEAKLITSGVVTRSGTPNESTQIEWIKETLFSTDTSGQTIGVDTEIDLKNKTQASYAMPIVWRADGAELDDISEEIMAKRGGTDLAIESATTDLANGITVKAGQMVDDVAISIIDGSAQWIITDSNNYNNANGSQFNLVDLEQTRSLRGEKGVNFEGGFMIMRGVMYHKAAALGLVASTSNTMGNMAQDEIVRSGVVGSILGMNILPTDKIALESSGGVDHIVTFIERGALNMKLSGSPAIDPVIRATRSFKDSIKFKISLGGIVKGLSWGSAKANPATITNTTLGTGTNYEQAATNIKNVPMACVRFDAPTF